MQIFDIVEELEKERKKNKKIKDIVDNIMEQFEKIKDKDFISNRYVDISVIEEIDRILKGSDNNGNN